MKTPFNIIILGTTGCGKTFCPFELLEKEYKNHFDYIYLVCPTFSFNKTYQNWSYVNDPDFVIIDCGHDQVEYFLRPISFVAPGTNSLIILDDVASGQAVKNRTNELVRLGFSARHYGLAVIFITQQLKSVSKPFRDYISKRVSFYNPSGKDMTVLFVDYLGNVDKNERKDIVNTLKSHDYA